MRLLPRNLIVSAVLLGASQMACAGLFSDEEAHKKIETLTQENQKLRQDVGTLEERVKKLDAQLNSQGLLDLMQQLENLKMELAKVRGQGEVNSHAIGTAENRQKDLYVDLDNRMRKLERTGDTPTATAPVAAATPNATSASSAPAPTADAAENRAYDSAFNLFKIGNYQAAIVGFQNFVKAYPASPLASNAQYWIGNSYSALRDYKSAIANQQKLLSLYPNSSKVPDAMLNMASSQADLGDKDAARKTLEDIIAKHPASQAADSAKKRLPNLAK